MKLDQYNKIAKEERVLRYFELVRGLSISYLPSDGGIGVVGQFPDGLETSFFLEFKDIDDWGPIIFGYIDRALYHYIKDTK